MKLIFRVYSVCTKVYQDIAVYKIIGGSSLQLNEQNLAHRCVPNILVLFYWWVKVGHKVQNVLL